jgi:hypothetical protein
MWSCSLPGMSPTAVEMSRKFSVPVGRTPRGGVSQPRPPSSAQARALQAAPAHTSARPFGQRRS